MPVICGLLLAVLAFTASAQASVFNLIYIEPSEGNASAGHFAIQLGDAVYHYQYEEGILHLFRHEAGFFQREYQNRQNRTLHRAHIQVSDKTYGLLESHYKQRLLQQNLYLKQRQALQQDFALLSVFISQLQGQEPDKERALPPLTAAGLFYNEGQPVFNQSQYNCQTAQASSKIITEVRRRLDQSDGQDFLPRKIAALSEQVDFLQPTIPDNLSGLNGYGFAKQYADHLNGILALQVLQENRTLVGTVCFKTASNARVLNPTAILQLTRYQAVLFNSTQNLLHSARPDWASALLVTLARLIVIEQTLHSGHWVFLDDSDGDTNPLSHQQMQLYPDTTLTKRHKDELALQTELTQLAGAAIDDYHYGQLEKLANRYQRWVESDETGVLRYHHPSSLPTKSVDIRTYARTRLSEQQVKKSLTAVQAHLAAIQRQDERNHTYNLLTNNCVTAIFDDINTALINDTTGNLAGLIQPAFNFIPYQAFAAVVKHYPVSHIEEQKSYRLQKLAQLYENGRMESVYAREFNVLSSSLYHYNPADSWFIFFTDDVVLPRPLYGVFNLMAGTGQSLWGALSLPFDGGESLKIGLRGLLTSFPELLFLNIRKGSYPYDIDHSG